MLDTFGVWLIALLEINLRYFDTINIPVGIKMHSDNIDIYLSNFSNSSIGLPTMPISGVYPEFGLKTDTNKALACPQMYTSITPPKPRAYKTTNKNINVESSEIGSVVPFQNIRNMKIALIANAGIADKYKSLFIGISIIICIF